MTTDTAQAGRSFSYDPDADVCYRELSFLGFPGYRVGDDGSVWCCRPRYNMITSQALPWRPVRPSRHPRGHLTTKMKQGGRETRFKVHQLVLFAFVGPRPPDMVCRHFPYRDPANNRLVNLRWGTELENAADRDLHGTTARGEADGNAKLTAEIVRGLRRRYAELKGNRRLAPSGTYDLLAREFGVNRWSVQYVVTGRWWAHVRSAG